jgi:tRNA dimethylallyltransferase
MTIKLQAAPVIFLMGPTASGKTALAIELYQQQEISVGFEIISVDSAMVYKDLNIGSAKPTEQELALAPHHLIDFVDPADSYSVSDFREDAIELINAIHARGNVPLLTGGTMLYFKALRDGLADMPGTDEKIREEVKNKRLANGLESLHDELATFDPRTAARLHVNDTQRITRAVEVYLATGKSLSQWHDEQQKNSLKNPILSIALAPEERAVLHARIEKRFSMMMEQGFLEEVKVLFNRPELNLECASMRSVGYRQVWQHLNGELSLPESIERSVIATRQLAKRQYTWLRSWQDAHWFDPTNENQQRKCINQIYKFVAEHPLEGP